MVLNGLEEFREHLGGELTITLLQGIGRGVEVHEVNLPKMTQAMHRLRDRFQSSSSKSFWPTHSLMASKVRTGWPFLMWLA